jgi:hypothetical protein
LCVLEVDTSRDANLSVVCLAPATTAAGRNKPQRECLHEWRSRRSRRGSPCCALSSLLALKIDPALGRPGSELLTAPEIAIRNPRSAAIPYEFPRYLHLAREKGLPERVQAECQCRAPSCNFLNCIVFSKLGGDRAAWTSGDSWGTGGPVPPGRWFSAMGWRSLSPRVKIRPVPNCRLENVVVDKSPL